MSPRLQTPQHVLTKLKYGRFRLNALNRAFNDHVEDCILQVVWLLY
jgi:hypothetical protein